MVLIFEQKQDALDLEVLSVYDNNLTLAMGI